jgi:hypothetical protein
MVEASEETLSGPKGAQPETKSPATKRPWQRPAVVYREPLEAVAEVCSPSPPAKAIPSGTCTSTISS